MAAVLRPLKWFYHEFGIVSIHDTGRNAYLLIAARTCRMFANGANSLILAIFIAALGFTDHQIGAFMTLTLVGDVFLGTYLTLIADRVGRRNVLMGGSILMMMTGLCFAFLENFWILLIAAIFGVVSVTGGDFGPFRSIEEADVLTWYVATSALGSSVGSEAAGRVLQALQNRDGWTDVDAYHALFLVYTAMGFANALFVYALTDQCELKDTAKEYAPVPGEENESGVGGQSRAASDAPIASSKSSSRLRRLGGVFTSFTSKLVHISAPTRSVMYKLWFLLGVDSLADGMVPISLTNYYMDFKFQPSKSTLGDLNSVSFFLGFIASTFASPLARRIGLINTMVFTHIPSSVAVLLFPLPSYFWMTALLLLIRSCLNPMDQAPRSAFIAAVVKPKELTAVMGITATIRTLASTTGPTITGLLAAQNKFWIAFVTAGACRLAYDFGLWALFVNMKLNQDEPKAEQVLDEHDSRRIYDEENLEMQSLADSDSEIDSEDGHKREIQ